MGNWCMGIWVEPVPIRLYPYTKLPTAALSLWQLQQWGGSAVAIRKFQCASAHGACPYSYTHLLLVNYSVTCIDICHVEAFKKSLDALYEFP